MGEKFVGPVFLEKDPRLTVVENKEKELELMKLARGEMFIIGYIPVMINIDGRTEKLNPLVELYTGLRKKQQKLFKLDVSVWQNNHFAMYEKKETELIELRFETANTDEKTIEQLSARFSTVFPAIKMIFQDLIELWVESPEGLPKYMEAFKERDIKKAEEAIDSFLISKGLKSPKKSKKPAK